MKLTDENGNEFEWEKFKNQDPSVTHYGTLTPIEKEWPQRGDDCWFVDGGGDIDNFTWCGNYSDNDYKAFGNVFKTQQEAELARDRIQSLQEASIVVQECGEVKVTLYLPKKYLKAWKDLEGKE